MEQTFEEYLKQARWAFARVAEKYPVEKNLELRTAIDSLLIAYDQAVHKALSLGDIVGQSEHLLAFLEWYDSNVCQNDCRSRDELVNDFISQ